MRRYPVIQQVSDTEYRLARGYAYYISSLHSTIIIHRNFVYDGASIPRFFWRIIGTPFRGAYAVPALIHDALYASHVIERDEADRIFLAEMLAWGECEIKAWIIFLAVRIGGWWSWRQGPSQAEKVELIK